jgi:hypothetical protein
VRPARWGSGFLRCGIDPGAAPTVCFAAPPLAVFGFAKRSLRSHPRINPSTQPSDVARGSRSKAVLELTLIVLSGEKPKRYRFAGWTQSLWELACQRWWPDSRPVSCGCTRSLVGVSLLAMVASQPTCFLRMYSIPCRSEPACDGGLTATCFLRMYSIPCRSEPARDGGLTVDLFLTGYPRSKCGSEPARESAPTVT